MATITNSICAGTSINANINLQSLGGAISLGTLANATTITIGDPSNTFNIYINAGTGNIAINNAITTTPVDSITAVASITSTGLGNIGTYQNSNASYPYDLLVYVQLSGATTVSVGVGPTSSPTTNTLTLSTGNSGFTVIVPYNYYITVTASGATYSGGWACAI